MNELLLIFAIHCLISLLFFGINIKKNGMQDSIYKLIIVFLMPVFGLLFFAIITIVRKTVKKSDKELAVFLESIQGEKYIYHETGIDFEEELNTVPMEDMLEFSDDAAKRAHLIYILKKDFSGHINSLQKAIKSEDSETSHYAASALMEIKKEFEILLQSHGDKYDEMKKKTGEKNGLSSAIEYTHVLKNYLKSNVANTIDYYDYLEKYSHVIGFILEKEKNNVEYFTEKVSTDIELGDFQSALDYCGMMAKYFPEDERTYISFLKLYYSTGDGLGIKKVLSMIKKQKIVVSDETLCQLDFWEGSEKCL